MAETVQNSRIKNMQNDMSRFYLINAEINKAKTRKINNKSTRSKADVYHLINAKDTSKTMEISVYTDGEVKCNCSDYTYRCYKNNFLCKHCCYILLVGMKMTDKNINGRYVDIDLYNTKKKILVDKFTQMDGNDNNDVKNEQYTENDDCQICLTEMQKEDDLHRCHKCKKFYHVDCIKIWKERAVNASCPNCRCEIKFEKITGVLGNAAKIKQLIEDK